MDYKAWKALQNRATISSGGRAGGRRAGIYIGVSVSELRSDPAFWVSYIRSVFNEWVLPHCYENDSLESLCSGIVAAMDTYDCGCEIEAGLRCADDEDLGSVNPDQLAFDLHESEVS